LYHLIAAATATLMKPLLPLHDGARLASGLFMAITLVAVAWSARHAIGDGFGRKATLMTLSAVGLIIHAHMMLTDLALMAGVAIAMSGLVACSRSHPVGGLLLGTGTGIAFLAKGLIGPGVIGATSLCLPIAFANWRNTAYPKQLGIAALVCIPWFAIWPIALYLRSPELFSIWLWDNNVGRFFGFSVHYLGAQHDDGYWWRTYPWFLFPLWIFVVPLFWRLGRYAWKDPAVQIGGILAATTVIVLDFSASAREVYALPLLPPLALVATAGVAFSPR
jgi:4-amino-4-deoxy-L-arabinose transferase-like glycosyltransferase